MNDRLDRLAEDYAAAFRAGDFDPTPFLDQLEGDERRRFERRLDLMFEAMDPMPWDPEVFERSGASEVVDRVVEATRCPSGDWPELLPELMHGKELPREAVARELAADLGATEPAEVEKVGSYLHQMTWGTLDARGVADRVLDGLARILDTSRERLREAGDALGRRLPEADGGEVFARRPTDESLNFAMSSRDRVEMRTPSAEPDRIDLLFTSRGAETDGD